jgi:hypothetical protein
MTANWIEDANRFNLPAPPQEVLTALWNLDPQLVLIPSRQDRTYLLARRRQYSAGMSDTVLLENKHPDTNMLFVNQLLPIAPLVFKGGVIKWEQKDIDGLIAALRARDTWAITGGPAGDPDRAWQAIEEAEKAEKAREKRTRWQDFHHRGRDAFRSIGARMGWRNKRASDYHGAARTPRVADSTQ